MVKKELLKIIKSKGLSIDKVSEKLKDCSEHELEAIVEFTGIKLDASQEQPIREDIEDIQEQYLKAFKKKDYNSIATLKHSSKVKPEIPEQLVQERFKTYLEELRPGKVATLINCSIDLSLKICSNIFSLT